MGNHICLKGFSNIFDIERAKMSNVAVTLITENVLLKLVFTKKNHLYSAYRQSFLI